MYSSTDDAHACHRGRGPAGYYGAETSDCDTPLTLVDATFKWIEEHLKDEIDFVIWTGDSAKHDNDDQIPRTEGQVLKQNRMIAEKFVQVFGVGKHGKDGMSIPIVPTLGNNDVFPHNIFKKGPNHYTHNYLDIWKPFIPQDQREEFAKGGWFSVEVIPNQLAVISLNTLYFFDSNSAVNGCIAKSEPGFEHFEWLRRQLDTFRRRGMKVILMGHVPPARVDSRADWVESCWQKYTLWMRQYRDIIVSSHYGHMNIDHFMLQDFHNIKKSVKHGKASARDVAEEVERRVDGGIGVASAKDYLNDLRSFFSKIPSFNINNGVDEYDFEDEPEDMSLWSAKGMMSIFKRGGKHAKKTVPYHKIGGPFGERYSLSFVAPSVVPNYFPTLRVFEYNTTGLADLDTQPGAAEPLTDQVFMSSTTNGGVDEENRRKKLKFTVPKSPSKSTPPGPAYSQQPLSLLSYTQYFANLTHINNDFANAMSSPSDADSNIIDEQRWKEGKHKGRVKKGKPHPRRFAFHVEYNTSRDKVFGLKDLTVRSYIDLAKGIGESEKKGSARVWHTFIRRAFVGAFNPKELERDFGLKTTPSDAVPEDGSSAVEL